MGTNHSCLEITLPTGHRPAEGGPSVECDGIFAHGELDLRLSHGAPKDFYHGYGKGRNETTQSGELQAAFDGTHGWFWRNRTNGEVTITLETSGDY
jgi:hypothetical protein